MAGLSPLAVEFGDSTTNAIDFGVVRWAHFTTTTKQKTFSSWVYWDGDVVGHEERLAAAEGGTGSNGWFINPGGGSLPTPYFVTYAWANFGRWLATNTLPVGEWALLTVSYDASSLTNDPVIYINGVAETLTEHQTPSGSFLTTNSSPFVLGNSYVLDDTDFTRPFNGKIFDFRIYNRILTQAEVTAIYNSGTPSMTAGPRASVGAGNSSELVLQAFTVRTEDLSRYVDQNLATQNLFDAQFKTVGTAHGSPIGRAAP